MSLLSFHYRIHHHHRHPIFFPCPCLPLLLHVEPIITILITIIGVDHHHHLQPLASSSLSLHFIPALRLSGKPASLPSTSSQLISVTSSTFPCLSLGLHHHKQFHLLFSMIDSNLTSLSPILLLLLLLLLGSRLLLSVFDIATVVFGCCCCFGRR